MKPKKILFFVGSLASGGAERTVVNLSAFLVRHGYEVVVVTIERENKDFYTLPPEVRRFCLGPITARHRLLRIPARARHFLNLRRLVRREKPDVVVGLLTACVNMAIVSCLGLPSKVVAAERNNPGIQEATLHWDILRRHFYRFADAHVAQSQGIADWITKNAAARNVKIIPNAVTWPIPSYEPILPPVDFVRPADKLLLAAGQLGKWRQKGFDLLLEAFAFVALQFPDWKLGILGSSKDRAGLDMSFLQGKAARHGLDSRVFFPGMIGNIADWYERADLFVLSSRYEGFPNVLLEAMAAGCACVAFDCDTGPRDIITHEVDGLLVEPENIDALAMAMQRLMTDEQLRTRLSAAAVMARDKFSEERILGMWKDVFESLC